MPSINVDGLVFIFPNEWKVSKYDDWVFYRKHFQKCGEPKAGDIVAVEEKKSTLWQIEVKNYRKIDMTRYPAPDPVKVRELVKTIAQKACDTLAGLVAARANANVQEEKEIAQAALRCQTLKIVFHCESGL